MFKSRQPQLYQGWFWRHEISPAPSPLRFGEKETDLDKAWRELVLIHTSFRATDQGEYGQIARTLRDIERMFLERPDLADYYDECHKPPGMIEIRVTNFVEKLFAKPATTENQFRHVAAIQARFMEDVYFVLQLARFANALDNRGWMNLFRSWGQSGRFNAVWDSMRSTFTDEFVEFYMAYIRYYPGPIEKYPVPHPWDYRETRQDPRILPADKYGDVLPGVFLDSGIQEARGSLPSPGSESRGVVEEETKTMSSKDNWAAQQDRGENTGSSSGGSAGPNN